MPRRERTNAVAPAHQASTLPVELVRELGL